MQARAVGGLPSGGPWPVASGCLQPLGAGPTGPSIASVSQSAVMAVGGGKLSLCTVITGTTHARGTSESSRPCTRVVYRSVSSTVSLST